jgi:hypothetical protein
MSASPGPNVAGHLGLPTEPLPTARAQGPPVTLELFSDP